MAQRHIVATEAELRMCVSDPSILFAFLGGSKSSAAHAYHQHIHTATTLICQIIGRTVVVKPMSGILWLEYDFKDNLRCGQIVKSMW